MLSCCFATMTSEASIIPVQSWCPCRFFKTSAPLMHHPYEWWWRQFVYKTMSADGSKILLLFYMYAHWPLKLVWSPDSNSLAWFFLRHSYFPCIFHLCSMVWPLGFQTFSILRSCLPSLTQLFIKILGLLYFQSTTSNE